VTGFDYIRHLHEHYVPRTPRAALLSVQEDILPIEAFVYKATSIKSLFEEPYDLEELERVLARRDLSFGDAMLLSEIFVAMTGDKDKELALFAAESLGALENRWFRTTESFVGKVRSESCEDAAVYPYARALYEYALIAGRYAAIRNFYLKEAYLVLSEHPESCQDPQGFDMRIRCLLRLGLLDQAESVIASELGKRSDGELLSMAVEAAFLRKDPRRVHELLAGRDLETLDLDEEQRVLLSSWRVGE
jgi:hypothetical protein